MTLKPRPLCACGCERPVKRPTSIYYTRSCVRRPRPICACGCGLPVKKWYCTYRTIACRWRHKPKCQPCKCGCGRIVKRPDHQYFEPTCVDRRARADFARKGAIESAKRLRRMKFGKDILQLDRRVTREDLWVVFQRVYERGYMAGYNARKHGFKKALSDVA